MPGAFSPAGPPPAPQSPPPPPRGLLSAGSCLRSSSSRASRNRSRANGVMSSVTNASVSSMPDLRAADCTALHHPSGAEPTRLLARGRRRRRRHDVVLRALNDRVELAALALGHAELRERSGHLGHTQGGGRQLEVALVEHLCSYFLAARGSDPVQLVSVPVPRFDAIEGRRGHATTGRSVDQQTGTAKSPELLECGQDSHLVEIDASVDLIRADLDPGGSDTGALTRAVLAMHGSDLPFLDLPATTQKLGGPVT